MHAIPTLLHHSGAEELVFGHEEESKQAAPASIFGTYHEEHAPLTREVWRTANDDHWSYVNVEERRSDSRNPETQPLARDGRRNYHYHEEDRKKDRGIQHFPTDTNDAVVNAINHYPTSPYVQNKTLPPPAQDSTWIPVSRTNIPTTQRNQLVLPFRSYMPSSLEEDARGVKALLGDRAWKKLVKEVEVIGGYNEQLLCCYNHHCGRPAMYVCFPCFYCCLFKHNEEYTTDTYRYWRKEFEAKNIDFKLYYTPGSLWNAFAMDDFELAPFTHCFCIDVSSMSHKPAVRKSRPPKAVPPTNERAKPEKNFGFLPESNSLTGMAIRTLVDEDGVVDKAPVADRTSIGTNSITGVAINTIKTNPIAKTLVKDHRC